MAVAIPFAQPLASTSDHDWTSSHPFTFAAPLLKDYNDSAPAAIANLRASSTPLPYYGSIHTWQSYFPTTDVDPLATARRSSSKRLVSSTPYYQHPTFAPSCLSDIASPALPPSMSPQQPTPSTITVGPLSVQHVFPTAGGTGVPVTVTATVEELWAQEVGLQCGEGSGRGARFVMIFGTTEVETRTEQLTGYKTSTSQQHQLLVITAYSPPQRKQANDDAHSTTSIRLKLVVDAISTAAAADMNVYQLSFSTGIVVGEYSYWQMSPRSSLMRNMEEEVEACGSAQMRHTPSVSGPGRSGEQDKHYGATQTGSLGLVHNDVSAPFSPGTEYMPTSSLLSPLGVDGSTASPRTYRSSLTRNYSETASPSPLLTPASDTSFTRSGSVPAPALPPLTSRSLSPLPRSSLVSHRANLQLHGNIQDLSRGWSHDEWSARRRLVQFWRRQQDTTIHVIGKTIAPQQYLMGSVVVSCIYWDVKDECYITSVDVIYLLEALIGCRFRVEEKNRIRRNLQSLLPRTIGRTVSRDPEEDDFFKLLMGFNDPKPRHIEKDIKIFPWKVLPTALSKIIARYSAVPATVS